MTKSVSIEEFIELADQMPIIDVRSENEFFSGHFPSAGNIPILSDEQRKIVGTIYKQNGREPAVFKGLELLGPFMSIRLKQGVKLVKDNQVLVHCWRGGMRSQFYAFLLEFYGIEPILLKGGYKAFRGVVLKSFEEPLKIIVLGGKTGSGKTILLNFLKEQGEQILDLEHVANHRGSTFGALGMEDQPSQEQFENNLFTAIRKLDKNKIIWIEDESRTIGARVIPEGIWSQMKTTEKIYLDRDFEERLNQIMEDYANFSIADLKVSMLRIGKRLGPQHVKRAIELLENGEMREAFAMALIYYDKTYSYNLEQNTTNKITKIAAQGISYLEITKQLISLKDGNK